MPIEIKMPQLSDTMDSGKILAWNKSEGDIIERGDILAEVETDKANLEIESFHSGTLLKIAVPKNSTAQVGEVIAYIGEAGEKVAEGNSAPIKQANNDSSSPDSSENNEPTLEPLKVENELKSLPKESHSQEDYSFTDTKNDDGRIKASPLAKKIAKQKNINLSTVQGSGPNGRIVKRDLDTAASSIKTQTIPSKSTINQTALDQSSYIPRSEKRDLVTEAKYSPLSKMRETIAKRMQQSVNESPHFYTTVSVQMDEAIKTRKALKKIDRFSSLSLNHLIIKAAAYALANEPRVNCAMKDGQLYDPGQINIGIITAIDDGLLIPVIKDAANLNLADLAFEAKAAIDRAKAGRPSAQDLVGGTFSISNMGMFDVENFTAIINPGQGAVLAVSATKETPVVEQGSLVIRNVMKTTLSVDHRIIDGIMSANFLSYFKLALETPALLME